MSIPALYTLARVNIHTGRTHTGGQAGARLHTTRGLHTPAREPYGRPDEKDARRKRTWPLSRQSSDPVLYFARRGRVFLRLNNSRACKVLEHLMHSISAQASDVQLGNCRAYSLKIITSYEFREEVNCRVDKTTSIVSLYLARKLFTSR